MFLFDFSVFLLKDVLIHHAFFLITVFYLFFRTPRCSYIVLAPYYELAFTSYGNLHFLFVYTTAERNEYHKYRRDHVTDKKFYCSPCREMGKYIGARLLEDENGLESLLLSDAQHICQSIKIDMK